MGDMAASMGTTLTTLQDLMSEKGIRDADLPLSVRIDVLTAVKVGDIMTREVETVEAQEAIASAAQIMLDNKYGCVPVLEDGVLTGILTEADFVRFEASGVAAGQGG